MVCDDTKRDLRRGGDSRNERRVQERNINEGDLQIKKPLILKIFW